MLPPLENPSEYFLVWSWSPDGKWLAGRRLTREASEGKGVLLYSVQSHKYRTLIDDGMDPLWLNDSRRLLVERQGKINIVDAVTGNVKELLAFQSQQIADALFP